MTLAIIGIASQNLFANSPVVIQTIAGIIALVALLAIVLLIIAVSISFTAVSYKILADFQQKKPLGELIKDSRKNILPVVALWGLMFVLMGSWFVFIIPGLLITFVLSFAVYGIAIKNRGALAAIKRSVALWQTHPRELFVKSFLMSIFFMLLSFIPNLLSYLITLIPNESIVTVLQVVLALASFIFSIILFVFTSVYGITVFEKAEESTPENTKASMWWIWLTTGLGWFILFAAITLLVVFVTSPHGEEFRQYLEERAEQEIAARVEDATMLDQEGASKLAEETFLEINVRRVAAGNKPLAKDPKLCEYAQQMFALYDQHGIDTKLVDEQFSRDVNDPAMYKKYFHGYVGFRYFTKFGASSLDTPKIVADMWASEEFANEQTGMANEVVADKAFRAGCVVANPSYIFFLVVD